MSENCPKCGKFLNEGELCNCDAAKDSPLETSCGPQCVSETDEIAQIQPAITEPSEILEPEANSIPEEFKKPDKASTEQPTSKCFNDKDSEDKDAFYHSEPLDESFNPSIFEAFTGEPIKILEPKTDSTPEEFKKPDKTSTEKPTIECFNDIASKDTFCQSETLDESFNPPRVEPFTEEPIEILEIKTDSDSQKKKYNNFSTNIISIIGLFFKKPYSSTILAAKYNLLVILFMVCIQAAAAGLFSIVLVNRLVDGSSKWLPSIDRVLGLGGWLRYWGQSINIPYLEIFFKIFAIVIIQFFILAGLFYVCGKLFGQKEGSFQAVVSVMGMASVISSAIILAATLLIPMLPLIINFMLILAFIATLLLNHAGVREVFSIDENKGIYLTPLVYILYFILISLFITESLNASLRYLF